MKFIEKHYLTYEDIDGMDHYEVMCEVRNLIGDSDMEVVVEWGEGEDPETYNREKIQNNFEFIYQGFEMI